jgi:formylglycine-generating enzyme
MKATGKKIRLPTEAEWEYACRAGTTTPFNCGKDMDSTRANMNGREPYGNGVKGKYLNTTMDVKQFKPNAWGLYDMHGNVAEVCADYAPKEADLYVDGITDPGAADPAAIEIRGPYSYVNGIQPRLNYRGGCYWSTGSECRSASHEPIADNRNGADFLGFRLVLIP